MFPHMALSDHTLPLAQPQHTQTKLKQHSLYVSSCGVDLALIFYQCWQIWRLFGARYFYLKHFSYEMVHLWWHLYRNPWPHVVFGIVPLRRGYRNKAWHTSPVVLYLEDLWGTHFLHPVNHKICQVYHTFVEEQFTSLFDEQLRG